MTFATEEAAVATAEGKPNSEFRRMSAALYKTRQAFLNGNCQLCYRRHCFGIGPIKSDRRGHILSDELQVGDAMFRSHFLETLRDLHRHAGLRGAALLSQSKRA